MSKNYKRMTNEFQIIYHYFLEEGEKDRRTDNRVLTIPNFFPKIDKNAVKKVNP